MRALYATTLLAVSLSYLAHVFDIFHETFWTAGLGDWIDPYFINYLLEHWYHSVATLSDPWSPPMFFPAQKTLGYSHGLILYAPFYIPVRLFLHPFQAYSLSLLIAIEAGIVCLYLIFRTSLRLSFVESLLLTTFFFTSQNVMNGTVGVWSQRASVFLIPPILLLMSVSFHRPPGRLSLAVAGVSGFLATTLFTHDFYTAQFAFAFAVCFVVAYVVVEGHTHEIPRVFPSSGRAVAERVTLALAATAGVWSACVLNSGGVRVRVLGARIASRDWRRPALIAVACVALFVWLRGVSRITVDLKPALTAVRPWFKALLVGAALGSALFLWIYLPAYLEHPGFHEKELLDQIRVRVSSRWTSPAAALRDLGVYDTFRSFKALGVIAFLSCLPWLRMDRKTRLYVLWAVAVSAVVFVIPLRIDGFSIWLSVIRRIPGFGAIRDPARVIFIYELAFIVAAGLFLTRFRRQPVYRSGICLLLLFFMCTDHHADVLGYERSIPVFRRWVEAPIDIDPACRSFFIKGASDAYMSRSDNMWALYAGDAMFISLNNGLPTLNGYSAWGPEGWALMNPQDRDYGERVREWIAKNQLKSVCELDIDARAMRLVSTN